jgi:predicted PurR-regulated permease PerM
MIKQVATATIVVLTIVVVGGALWYMREAAQLLIISLAISSALNPLIVWLNARGIARNYAIGATFVFVLVCVSGALVLIGFQAIADVILLLEQGPQWYEQVRAMLLLSEGWLYTVGNSLPSSTTIVTLVIREDISQIGSVLGQVISQVAITAVLIISAASLGVYWLSDQQRIERLWLSLLPLRVRTMIRTMWNQIYQEAGIYIQTEFLLASFSIIILFLMYRLLGIPGAMLIALGGGIIQVVPVIGIPLAIVPAMLLGATINPLSAGLALVATMSTLIILRYVVAPRFLRGSVPVNPVLVIVLIMALAELAGLWTIVFGPPLAAAIQVGVRVARSSYIQALNATHSSELQHLRERLDTLEAHVNNQPEVLLRLQGLLVRTRKLVTEAATIQNEG